MTASLRDARVLGEALVVVVATWLVLGWTPDHAITQIDGSQLIMPYLRGSLAAGPDWTHYLYRFGVLGGSEMHAFGGTMPLVQLCALAGASTTLTCNAITWFVQITLAYFAVIAIEALATVWRGADTRLGAPARVVVVWLVAFAPVVGWRLGIGHENLLLGLLPFVATVALMLAASCGRVTATSLAWAAFAVANGVSGLGAQTVVYGAVFGAPLAIAAILVAPRGQRWTRARAQAIAALVGGTLLVLPRVLPMIAHASSDDASRGFDSEVVYSFITSSWSDWLASIPWTDRAALALQGRAEAHEYNFPLGPIALFAIALWPRGASRKLLWTALASAIAAIVLADHIAPLSEALLAALPPLRAFRVPSRAILPVAVTLPVLALAAWTAAVGPTEPRVTRASWIGIGVAAVVAIGGGAVPAWPREVVAWLACGALVVLVRWRPELVARRALAALLAPIAALCVLAFAERLPQHVPVDTVEGGPARLRDAVIAETPEAASPLVRVEIPDAPLPFGVSTAFAADVGSLDGLYYPPRRFLDLYSAFSGSPVSPQTCNFSMTHFSAYPAYQQMYDVVGTVQLSRDGGAFIAAPPPVGLAWFPRAVDEIADGGVMVKALIGAGDHLHDAVADTGWLLRADAAPVHAIDPACARAAVRGVAIDGDGQVATLTVDSPADCALIVSTNYVSTFRATADGQPTPVFPIDIALTGIAVPGGATTIVLAPVVDVPWWSYLAAALGGVLLAAALADRISAARSRRRAAARPAPPP